MKKPLLVLAIVVTLATVLALPGASQADLFWSANSSQAGNGTWDVNSTTNWRTTASNGAPTDKWTPNDGTVIAAFSGNAGTGAATGSVSIGSGLTINASAIRFQNTSGNFDINGGTSLKLSNTTASVVMQTSPTSTNAQSISSVITGTDITVANNYDGGVNANARTLLLLNGTNTFTGNLTLGGTGTGTNFSNANQVSINTANALPTTATVNMARNFSQLLFTAGGNAVGGANTYSHDFTNSINLNSPGIGTFSSGIGAANPGTVATLSGVISGSADLNIQTGVGGGQGIIILNNNETYTGKTTISTAIQGILRLGVDNALPATGGLSFGAGSLNVGAFDMAGKNQTVVSLGSNTTGNVNGVINTSGTLSTLTISGVAVTNDTSYKGNIGIPTVSAVTGATDNIKLVLASTNTASLTLTNSASTYTGGTKIAGGSIIFGGSLTAPLGTGTVELAGGKLTTNANRTVPLANALNVTGNSSITTSSNAGTVGFEFSSNSFAGSAGTLTFKNEGANDAADTFRPRFTGSGFSFARPIVIDNGSVGKTILEFFNPSSTSQTFSGDISGSGAVNRSSSSGAAGETVFSGTNSYDGGTAVNNSTLTLTNPNGTSGTGTGNVTLTNSGVLNVGNGGDSGDLSGNITATSGTVNFNRSTDLTYDGAISGTAGVVTKSGANSIVTLGSTNSYGGATTVNGGTLRVNGSITGIGAVTVKNGGTLAGTGSVAGAVTVESGGFVGPGAPPAVLTVGSLSFQAGSTQLYDIDSSLNTNIGADAMKVLGGVTIDTTGVGVALNANDLATPQTQMVLPPGTRFTLMAYNATAGLTGNFVGLLQGNPITIGLTTFVIDYHDLLPGENFTGQIPTAGSGFNYVTLTAVPEASSVLFGGLVCIVLGVAVGGRKLLRRSMATC